MPTQQAAKGKMKGVVFSGKKNHEERCKSFIESIFIGTFQIFVGALLQVIQLWASVMVAVPLGGFPFLVGPFSCPNASDTKSDRVALMFFPLNLLYTLYVH